MIQEARRSTLSGWLALAVLVPVAIYSLVALVQAGRAHETTPLIVWAFVLVLDIVLLCGLFMVAPNVGVVLQLFGAYVGSTRDTGLRWANPLLSKRHVSLRIRNFESGHLKVNDADGNPIEIAAVVVWRVVDTAEACFEVDDYKNYVQVQSEAALRNLATRYPYDSHEEQQISLRGSTADVAGDLQKEVQARLAKAGVEVVEARISHLAYAPEIASAMLRRQQAGAIIAARQKIVEGAVSMVDMALERLDQSQRVTLDEERKAAMVSNLLVVLCADREAQPVVNTGTLYQ